MFRNWTYGIIRARFFAVNNIYSDSRYNIIVLITIARAHITYKGQQQVLRILVSLLYMNMIRNKRINTMTKTLCKMLFEWWTFSASFKVVMCIRAGLGQMATL